MYQLPIAWLRRNSVFVLTTGLAALAMGGCPPTGPGTGSTTVDVTTVGEGTVTQSANGDLVTLTASPADGWIFDGWSGAALDDQGANPLTVDVNEIDSITANFMEDVSGSPGDSDGDGVRNVLDECPGTPPGTSVDARGCSAVGPDADDDGVPDSADACADTVAGSAVDLTGCAAEQLDSDSDGVNDAIDECDRTPLTVEVDDVGCPVSEGGPDDDEDGVPNDIDQCEDTAAGADVDPNGCADSQLDTDGDGVSDDVDVCPVTPPRTPVLANGCPAGEPPPPPPPPQNCGNGVVNPPEECDGSGESALCNANCTLSRCGDLIVNAHTGERCDDGNILAGDGCFNCQLESPPSDIPNDDCADAVVVGDGTLSFNNQGAQTDGPDEPATCDFFGQTNVDADIWYCYTASCTGTVLVSLCGSDYDTKVAVYAGCACPSAAPLACSDDDCGTGVENVQSRVTFSATAGQSYLVRVGGFLGEQGDGRLTIGCNVDACANGSGDCFAASANDAPGCGDATCCTSTCELDRFCCDVIWDATCAGEAQGVCTGSYPACAPQTGNCGSPDNTPGCDNVDCCNTVCATDPYCCLSEWDSTCVDEAESMCFLTCGREAGDCHTVHGSAGCNSETCCAAICADDPFCCDTEWDNVCVELAAAACP